MPVNVSTATTTTVKSGAGFLGQIIINGGTMGNVTIYDNTAGSGTTIATLDGANLKVGMVFPYGCVFSTGLTVVTAAATDITVCYA